MDRMVCDYRVVGPVQTNCYFYYNEDTRECIIVDPGDEFSAIRRYIEENNLKVCAVLLTHGHFDHIMAVNQVREQYGVQVYASEEEREIMTDTSKNLSGMAGAIYTAEADRYLRDGETIELMGREIRCILTPGHTSGGMCYYFPGEAVLFSGDTLFQESVGRTDFPTSSTSELIRSIREKLFILPEAVRVYPGHGPATSIGNEKMFNPFATE